MDQEEVFARSEGDQWFTRNSAHLKEPARFGEDHVLRALRVAGVSPSRVLEIGATNGYRLDTLRRQCGCSVLAIEPSALASADGRQRFPEVPFIRAVASDVPLLAGVAFDLVIVNFVLHWVGRSRLLRSIAEIDRLVAEAGYLAIGDFDADAPERVPYHHLPDQDVWTYKQDYAAIFLASALYETSFSLLFEGASPKGPQAAPARNSRGRLTLLHKHVRTAAPR